MRKSSIRNCGRRRNKDEALGSGKTHDFELLSHASLPLELMSMLSEFVPSSLQKVLGTLNSHKASSETGSVLASLCGEGDGTMSENTLTVFASAVQAKVMSDASGHNVGNER